MSKFRQIAGTAMMAVALLGAGGCNSDSPTESGSAPMISQLQVQGAQRISGDVGVVGIQFAYADPDADIDRLAFRVEGAGTATTMLSGTGVVSGVVSLQHAVTLPAPGDEVRFSIFVVDRGGNSSNTLESTFTAP